MTEAMSRREIEDVLTSIKRLVSQDVPGRAAPAPVKEKLVLTPALRVPEVANAPDRPQSGADRPEPRADSASPDAQPNRAATDAVSAPPATDRSDAQTSPLPGRDGSLLRRIAQAGMLQEPAAPEQPASASAPEDADADADILAPQADDAEIEATLARLEAVLSGKAPPAPHESTPSAPDSTPVESAKGEQVIDEGMLYQLVAHIVRQELQGELGEKITRNIRKLVRAEVARELQLRRS